jgi:chromosomal replication initiator protein
VDAIDPVTRVLPAVLPSQDSPAAPTDGGETVPSRNRRNLRMDRGDRRPAVLHILWTSLWKTNGGEGTGTLTDAAELWTGCADRLRSMMSDATWRTWFDQIQSVELDDRKLSLSAPSTLVRERLEERYLGVIQGLASEMASRQLVVELSVRPAVSSAHSEAMTLSAATAEDPGAAPGQWASNGSTSNGSTSNGSASNGPTSNGSASRRAGDPGRAGGNAAREAGAPHGGGEPTPRAGRNESLSLNPRYTFEAFVIGASNRFAHAAAQRVAETPAASYNPLFIHGDSGLGKTHLLHAIGHYVAVNFPGLTIRYVSTETFLNDFVDAIRTNGQPAFKRRYRDCDVLLVDDIQFIEGKEGLQEEFFHTFNALYEHSKQIVLSSDRHPRSIATLEDRLRSRFEWGLITDVQPPELETRLAILRKKADGEQTPIPADVLELIATHVKDNIRELEGALIRVSAFASLNREPLTLEMAEVVLSDILDVSRPRQITAKLILDTTATVFGFSVDELCGSNRRRPLVNARQIGMYVFRDLTDYSYPAIGREFGNRDHTTVIHAVEKISGLMKERRQVYDQVTELIVKIKGGA